MIRGLRYIILVCVMLTASIVKAQTMEVGLMAGISNYSGDLSSAFFIPEEIHPGGGVFFRVNLNEYVSLRYNLMGGQISGSDEHQKDFIMRERRLIFKSMLYESSIQGELTITRNEFKNYRTIKSYSLLGIGLVRSDPKKVKGVLTAEWTPVPNIIRIREMIDTYQDDHFKKYFLCFPIGFGIRYKGAGNLTAGIEIAMRYLFTDKLENFSPSGSNGNDVYAFSLFTCAYSFEYKGRLLGARLRFSRGTNYRNKSKF